MLAIEPGAPLPSITITDGVIALRPFDLDDLPLIERAATDPFIPAITTVPATYTDAAGRQYIERQHDRLTTGAGWSLAIVMAAAAADGDVDGDGVAVGQIGLWIGQLSKGRAEIGYWVAPGSRRSGAASRALALLAGWAFEQLDVDRLSAFVEPWNDASIRTVERAGFTCDGLLRGWERIDGDAKDMLSFARLRTDA